MDDRQETINTVLNRLAGDPWRSMTTDNTGKLGIAATGIYSAPKSYRTTTLQIIELENGKMVELGGRKYIVPEGSSVLEIIGQALVEAKLEE